MEEKKLVPKRRFVGFDGEWEENIFLNLGVFGKTYSFSRSKEGFGEYHHIHYGDIHTKNYGVIDNDSFIPTIIEKADFELLSQGDIVIADASEDYKDLGKATVVRDLANRKIIAGLHTFKFTPNENLSAIYYLYYSQTNIFKSFSARTGTGISVFGLSKENLGKMKLFLPTLKEQQKIGQFFKVLDERIANQERKIAKVKALKEAYLTEMFPHEGETIPKRRFKGFEAEWIEVKLDNIVNISTGYPFSSKDFKQNGKYKIITNKNIRDQDTGISNVYDLVDINEIDIIQQYKLSNINVLVSMDGDVGITGKYTDEKALLAQRVGRLSGGNIEFVYQATKRVEFREHMDNISVGNIIKHISLNQIKEYVLTVPKSSIEQQKIGQFFKNLDDQIATVEAKLEKLKKMKEAYLEEMFV